MIRPAPARAAPWIAFSPTPPAPTTATRAPGRTRAVFTTAPTPVMTPQASRHASSGGRSSGSGTHWLASTTTASAKAAVFIPCASAAPAGVAERARRRVPGVVAGGRRRRRRRPGSAPQARISVTSTGVARREARAPPARPPSPAPPPRARRPPAARRPRRRRHRRCRNGRSRRPRAAPPPANGPGGVDRDLLDGQGLAEGPADGGAHAHGSLRASRFAAATNKRDGLRPPAVAHPATLGIPATAEHVRWRPDHDRRSSPPCAGRPAARAPPPRSPARGGLTLAQVEREYPRMNAVHIKKCDYDGDGLYTRERDALRQRHLPARCISTELRPALAAAPAPGLGSPP